MDKASITTIADRHLDAVYHIVLAYCKNAEDASDAVQNAFLKLMSTNTAFKDDDHIRKWLIRVAINECRNFWHSFWRRNIVSLDELYEENENHPAFSAEESSADARGVYEAVLKLPDRYRTVVQLYYCENYSVDEIAGILRISPTNVQTRLYRGRKKLKDILEKGAFL